jgi:hypothetical protein
VSGDGVVAASAREPNGVDEDEASNDWLKSSKDSNPSSSLAFSFRSFALAVWTW